MALMLAMAEASCAGICDLVIFGMVKAAMIKMIVTTISNSINVKPRSRLRLDMYGPHSGSRGALTLKGRRKAAFVSALEQKIIEHRGANVKAITLSRSPFRKQALGACRSCRPERDKRW